MAQVTSLNTFGNTVSWINGINTGVLPNINTGYHNSMTQLSQYSPYELSGMDPFELGRVQSQYASIELVGRRKYERDGHHRFDPLNR